MSGDPAEFTHLLLWTIEKRWKIIGSAVEILTGMTPIHRFGSMPGNAYLGFMNGSARFERALDLVRLADLQGLNLSSLQETVLTSAIDTVVCGTGAAHNRQFLRNCLPGAVESDGRVVGGHTPGAGKGLHGFSGQINLLYCCTVLGLQVVDNFPNACTGLSL
jgi:hypothetical protein